MPAPPGNALGRLKFNMPNGYDVYLHDTPAQSLFAGNERAIRLTTPQPVYVLYWTAWVGDDGKVYQWKSRARAAKRRP
jgi:murein L,D-transpeptidase YcbB/YkuD